jgi:hypothetical protein
VDRLEAKALREGLGNCRKPDIYSGSPLHNLVKASFLAIDPELLSGHARHRSYWSGCLVPARVRSRQEPNRFIIGEKVRRERAFDFGGCNSSPETGSLIVKVSYYRPTPRPDTDEQS